MNWRITYRAKDGKQSVAFFEADSRDALFRLLASKGINAIRVEQTNEKTSAHRTQRRAFCGWVIMAIAAIIIAVGGYFLYTHLGGGDAKQDDGKMPKRSAVTREAVIKDAEPSSNTVVKTGSSAQTVSPRPVEDTTPPNKKIVEMISVITNVDGSVLERFRTADGKIRSRQSAPKPVFDNASDQIIAMAASGASSGYAMPPMPVMNNADEEFIKSLETEITIDSDDSDEVKALKQNVIAIREEIRQLMSEGHSFAEVIRDHRDVVNHGVEMRKEATRMIKEFVDSGDNDAANECLEKVNEVLAGMGIQKVEMPLTDAERRELIRERHRNGN